MPEFKEGGPAQVTTTFAQANNCTWCGNGLILYRGMYVCNTCGTVAGPEYIKSNNHFEDHFVEENGSLISFHPSSPIQRMRYLNYKIDACDHHLILRKKELAKFCSIFEVNKQIKARANFLFSKLLKSEKKCLSQNSKLRFIPILMLSILVAMREANYPFTFSKVIAEFKRFYEKPGISKMRELATKYPECRIILKPKNYKEFIPELLSKVIINYSEHPAKISPTKFQNELLPIIDSMIPKIKQPHGPSQRGFAASMIYVASLFVAANNGCKYLITLMDFGKYAEITHSTITRHKKYFLEVMNNG